MPRRRTVALLSAAAILAGLTVLGVLTVVTGEAASRAYVVRETSGELVIGYRNCPGESIQNVTVYDVTASSAVLWKVSRVGDVQVTRVGLGQVPGGFAESSPYAAPATTHTIRVGLEGSSGAASTVEFAPANLPVDQYWDAGAQQPSPLSQLKRTGSTASGC